MKQMNQPKYIQSLFRRYEPVNGLPKGVRVSGRKYTAYLYDYEEQQYLGTFDTPTEAHAQWQLAYSSLINTRLVRYRRECRDTDAGIVQQLAYKSTRLMLDAANGIETNLH